MTSGKDPGALGFYGFRNRKDHSYDALFTANATAVREKRVWDILSRAGKKVAVLGVPQTYPPKPVNGWLVSGFLAPESATDFTYPKALKQELDAALGRYIIDVKDFRTEDKDGLIERIFALMHNRFDAARHLMDGKPWDFFMLVEMGMDRLHHALWRFCDPRHPQFEPGNPYENIFRDFYQAVDERIGDLVSRVGDDTAVLVVSDHGAKPMVGGICVNQWLMQEGLLALHNAPDKQTRIEDCRIDWAKTKAWSTGGYYARIFINVQGREPEGVVRPEDYEAFRDDLVRRIEAMPDHEGRPLGSKAHKPRDLYRKVNGVAPDLIVYFGDLNWRSVGSVGYNSIYTFENDTGPDDANHDHHGIFIMDNRSGQKGVQLEGLNLMDVAPTILGLLGVETPPDMQGRPIT